MHLPRPRGGAGAALDRKGPVVARTPAPQEQPAEPVAEVDADPVRSVLDQVLAAEAAIAPAMSTDQREAADKRKRAALGEPGYREQSELAAIEAERARFVERKQDTAHIDAEIARRRKALGDEA